MNIDVVCFFVCVVLFKNFVWLGYIYNIGVDICLNISVSFILAAVYVAFA